MRRRSRAGWALTAVYGVLLVWLFALPLAMLVCGAFRSSPYPPASWTLAGFDRVYGDAETWRVLATTGAYGLVTALLGTSLAVAFVLMATRTTAPLRRLITPSMIVLLAIPRSFYALAWAMAGAGSGGLINHGMDAIGADGLADGFSLQNWYGVIGVSTVKTGALAYLLLYGPIVAASPSTTEAARISGARRLRAFFGIELPILLPALLATGALALILTMQEFEVPAILGLNADVDVLSTSIYRYLLDPLGPDYSAASSAALSLVAVVVALVLLQTRLLGGRSFVTVNARADAVRTRRPSRWRWGVTGVIVLWLLIVVVLPVAQMLVGALQPYFGVYGHWTTSNFAAAWQDPGTRRTIVVTILGSVLGGLIAVVAGFCLAYTFTRRRGRIGAMARFGSWVPATMPGLVFGLALLWVYSVIPGLKELFGTIWPLLIGLVVSVLPFAVRALEGTLVQISPDLEEAARLSGDGFAGAVWRILVPLTRPATLAAWVLVSLIIAGTLDVPLLLASPGTNTVATLTYTQYQNGGLSQAAALYCLALGVLAAVFLVLFVLARILTWRAARLRARSTASVSLSVRGAQI